ncbi:MAG: SprT family zinc-dependent metalloprotease [Pseudomonadota bacterium]
MFSLEVTLIEPSSVNPKKIPCAVRLLKQSRCLRVQISPTSGLLVTAPKRTSQKMIHQFVEEHRDWITHHWTLYQVELASPTRLHLPTRLDLAAFQECWTIRYEKTDRLVLSLREQDNQQLEIKGNVDDIVECQKLVKRWLKSYAHRHFDIWLNQVAEEISIPYQQLVVRTQKTRWGSCTAQGKINLNTKLVFLSNSIVRYVMIHELCHIRFMNHSPNYWKLVQRFEPSFKAIRLQIRQEAKNIPEWI